MFCCRNVVERDGVSYELCYLHTAKQNPTKLIEYPTYNSIDKAAKVAAKIISHYTSSSKNNVREYGIGIYKRIGEENGKKIEKFCLVETREGVQPQQNERAQVEVDNTIGIELKNISNDSKIYRKFNGTRYSFEAHVHSHPQGYDQEFSIYDYIGSYAGSERLLGDSTTSYRPYTIYLVAKYQLDNGDYKRKLTKFIPPIPNEIITSNLSETLDALKNRQQSEKNLRDRLNDFLKRKGGHEDDVTKDVDK